MADQNVNIQFFDREGGSNKGTVPPGAAPSPEGNSHTPPPGYDPNQDKKDRDSGKQNNTPPEPESFPIGHILYILGSAVNPILASTVGQPVASAVGSVLNVGRSISNLGSVLSNRIPPPAGNGPGSPPTPPGTPPGGPGPVPGPGSGGPGAPTPPGPGSPPGPTPPGGGGPTPPGPGGPVPPGGGGGPPMPGPGALTGLAALGPEAIAVAAVVAATIGAVAALTAAFFYAKDKLIEAADDVSRFAPDTARASAQSRVQDVMNRVNRAQDLEPQFAELINLQTQTNKLWYEINTEFMKVVGPVIIDGMKTLNAYLIIFQLQIKLLETMANNVMSILKYMPKLYGAMDGVRAIRDWLLDWDNKNNKQKQLDIMREADALLNPLLRDVQAGKVPRNKGLGG